MTTQCSAGSGTGVGLDAAHLLDWRRVWCEIWRVDFLPGVHYRSRRKYIGGGLHQRQQEKLYI